MGVEEKRPRFSLLHFEEREVHLGSFRCVFCQSAVGTAVDASLARVRGKLHIGTSTAVVEPDAEDRPLLRIPFKSVRSVGRVRGVSLLSTSVSELHTVALVFLRSTRIGNPDGVDSWEFCDHRSAPQVLHICFPDAPFDPILDRLQSLHSLQSFSTSGYDDALLAIVVASERDCRLNLQRNFEYRVREAESTKRVVRERKSSAGDVKHTQLNVKAYTALNCTRVSPFVREKGQLVLIGPDAAFFPYHVISDDGVIADRVVQVARRRFTLQDNALEIFYEHRPSLLLVFLSTLDRNTAFELVLGVSSQLQKSPAVALEMYPLEYMTHRWQNGGIDNFSYLSYLNLVSGRTKRDFSQYPVFPWVLQDYQSERLDFARASTFRDLSRPIAALNEDRVARAVAHYYETKSPDQKFMYSAHYSTPEHVLYFLLRQYPLEALHVGSGRFDSANRIFRSIAAAWRSVNIDDTDVKELIPEFFDGDGSFLENRRHIALGTTVDGKVLGDVELPLWADDAQDFVRKNREALESRAVSKKLHMWIDLVFGSKQRGVPAELARNVFHPLCYEVEPSPDLSPADQRAIEAQVCECGQIPRQLFVQDHPARKHV